MKSRWATFGWLCLALMTAVALTIASACIQRLGPEVGVFGNLCGPTSDDPCYEPLLKGGFPAAYLFDSTATSVLHQLGPEDDLHGGAFVMDVAVYFAAILFVSRVVLRRWRASKRGVEGDAEASR